jgi:hypothetical protein
MSPTHPFRISRKSPLDDNGPNSAAHRRCLAPLALAPHPSLFFLPRHKILITNPRLEIDAND